MTVLETVVQCLSDYDGWLGECEGDVQDEIERLLRKAEISFVRELRLSPQDRVDFCVSGVVVEVKLKGTTPALVRQLHRYAQHETVTALVVVTTRVRLTRVPTIINGRPVVVVPVLELCF